MILKKFNQMDEKFSTMKMVDSRTSRTECISYRMHKEAII